MSKGQSYQSRMADLKLKRFASHWQSAPGQAADRDSGEPQSSDNHSIDSSNMENPRRSGLSIFNGLKVGQAGMIWGPDGMLLGRVQDDGLASPEELEGYPLNERGEVLDEDGRKVAQALVHEIFADTRPRGAREHSFYKIRPDEDGRYHCPYAALEVCGYRPQKLKSSFDDHLDSHLKPYRCNFGECADTHFSSAGCLLRHEKEVHRMHGRGATARLVCNYNEVGPFEGKNTLPFSPRYSHGDTATCRTHGRSRDPYLSPFPDCDHLRDTESRDEEDISGYVGEAHVLAPPVAGCGGIPSSESNDNAWRKGSDSFDRHIKSKHTVPVEHPRLVTDPLKMDPEPSKEGDERIMIDMDFLQRLESKISNLQFRVEECEATPGSPTNSSICDSQDSVDSVFGLGHRSIPATRGSPHSDDDFLVYGPEVRKERRDASSAEVPSLAVARWKCLGANQRFEAVDEAMSSRPVVQDLNKRPLLALIEDYQTNSRLWRKRLEIASPAFLELLKEVSCHDIGDNALHEGVFYVAEPFMVLFLNRKQLTDYIDNTNESTLAKEHAKFILDFMKCEFSDISRTLDNFESVTPPKLVKYCDLWMLYRPGTTVYSRANGEWEAFIVDSLDGMQVRKPSPDNRHAFTRLDIRAWSMDFDGEVYGRVWSIHCVAPFDGVRDISSLPLVPENFLLGGETIKESLLSRGKKFCNLQGRYCQQSETSSSQSTRVMIDHLTYQKRNGWLISINGKYGPSSAKNQSWKDNRYSDWDTSGEAFDRRARRYTSPRSLVRHFEDEYCSRDYELDSVDKLGDTQAEPCRRYSTDRSPHAIVRKFEKYDLIRPDAEMDELTLMLYPQHVRGFCFRDKMWTFLNVSQLEPVSFQENIWERLVLDEDYKDILETMASSHINKVDGLRSSAGGKGLSILLHGEPGVGKTLTAESIAEHFGKPLFPVNCSDIGTSLSRFDEKLEEISDYAHKWGTILLFDEADVLLQARRDYECANLKRNDLVSSFLRFVEYYQGIVFITTNRVSRFDNALMQRIDITLGLPPLDRGHRAGIWYNQIQDLFDEGTINASQSADLRMHAQQSWSKNEINGHQIKKAISTARIMAGKKGKILGQREVETMLKLGREFEERVGLSDKSKQEEKAARNEKGKEDLEGFEQVEKP